MGKVGRFVSDPKAGAFCQIALDSGEKILVSHDKGGFKGGRLSIAMLKWSVWRRARHSSNSIWTRRRVGRSLPASRPARRRVARGPLRSARWSST